VAATNAPVSSILLHVFSTCKNTYKDSTWITEAFVVKEVEAVSSNNTAEPEVDKARQHSVQLAHYAWVVVNMGFMTY